jgi:hypothetical protein
MGEKSPNLVTLLRFHPDEWQRFSGARFFAAPLF